MHPRRYRTEHSFKEFYINVWKDKFFLFEDQICKLIGGYCVEIETGTIQCVRILCDNQIRVIEFEHWDQNSQCLPTPQDIVKAREHANRRTENSVRDSSGPNQIVSQGGLV